MDIIALIGLIILFVGGMYYLHAYLGGPVDHPYRPLTRSQRNAIIKRCQLRGTQLLCLGTFIALVRIAWLALT